MIKVENIDTWGFEHAIRGMRNPLNSWNKSDSIKKRDADAQYYFDIGDNDLQLMKKLYIAGTEHRKYLRQIFVSMDITAPLYWWKEFDTYKIGTVSNSCSTMHKIQDKLFELNDFSHEHLITSSGKHGGPLDTLSVVIADLNHWRERYLVTKDKKYWWQMIQLLPTSYNQKRTVTMNYENVITIIHQRTNHKLDEWNDLIDTLKNRLPYVVDILKEKK